MNNMQLIFRALPRKISYFIENNLHEYIEEIEEIRIRANKKTIIKYNMNEIIVDYVTTPMDILNTLQVLCDNSIYSYQSQICQGFITILGGHRIGITGSAVMQNGKVININYISSLNFRIAKEIKGISNNVLPKIIDNNEIKTTLIVSPPGYGKTTLLRDLVRNISDNGFTVSLVDERGEIAAMYKGVPQNDVGIRTDVIENVTKSIGMKIAVRTMTPQVIVADEIGTTEDIDAINYAMCSGVKGIFTAHGGNIDEMKKNEILNKLYQQKVLERIIFLEKMGKVGKIYKLDKNMNYFDDEKVE